MSPHCSFRGSSNSISGGGVGFGGCRPCVEAFEPFLGFSGPVKSVLVMNGFVGATEG